MGQINDNNIINNIASHIMAVGQKGADIASGVPLKYDPEVEFKPIMDVKE